MTQTVPATCVLGPGKTGLAIGLRVLNLDGTTYSAFATTDVAETSTLGTYRKSGGAVVPDAGGYIVWGVSGTDYAEATVDSTAVNVTMQQGVAVAAADANGNVPVVLYGTQGAVEFGQVKITATGNNAAMIIQGAGGGSGVEVISGLTGQYALYLGSQQGHGVYINAGRVGMNISGNDLNDGSSAIDIYNHGWTDADTIRIDNGVALGSALQIRGWGAEPTIKVNSFGAGDAVEITTASGNAMTLNGLIVEDMIAATGIRSAVGLAAANLDTQLAALPTDQDVRDAMKLAPTAGAPAAGSVDAKLDDLLTAGDPWSTALPGAYGAGTAGALLAGIDGNVDLLLAADTSTSDATTAGAISRRRGNSWAIPLTIGAITGYTSLWFTIKSSYDDADTAALVQVKLNSPSALDGLLYVNGTTASSAALGSITVSNATTGAIVVNVDETITDDLAPGTYYYDVQTLIAGAVATPDSGVFTVTADVTRSVA